MDKSLSTLAELGINVVLAAGGHFVCPPPSSVACSIFVGAISSFVGSYLAGQFRCTEEKHHHRTVEQAVFVSAPGLTPVSTGTHLATLNVGQCYIATTPGPLQLFVKDSNHRDNVGFFVGTVTVARVPAQSSYLVSTPLSQPIVHIPEHTRGDEDFKGHGPRVTLDGSVYLDGCNVFTKVRMKAEEWSNGPKRDHTTAETGKGPNGKREQEHLVGVVPRHLRALGLRTPSSYRIDYIDNGHGVDRFTPPGSVLQRADIVGDTRGKEAGDAYESLALDPRGGSSDARGRSRRV